MKGKLFIAGGGSEKQSIEIDEEFVKEVLKSGSNILYIPIAINEKKHPYEDCLNWIRNCLSKYGKINITMLTDLNNKNSMDLKKYNAIYIGGGNTFKLMKLLTDSKFGDLITKYYYSGGIIYGGSAGAIILGKSIKVAEHADVNEVNLKKFEGLNLIDGKSVWPHYSKTQDFEINKFINENKLDVIAVPEDSGLIFFNGKFKVKGKFDCFFFNNSGEKLKI